MSFSELYQSNRSTQNNLNTPKIPITPTAPSFPESRFILLYSST